MEGYPPSIGKMASFNLICFFLLSYLLSPCSSEIYSKVTVDSNWLPIDENFPSTVNSKDDHHIQRFYYKPGAYNIIFHPTNHTLQELAFSRATVYHVDFQYWANAKDCVKVIRVYPTKTSTELTRIGEWDVIQRNFVNDLNKSFDKFFIQLYSSSDCGQGEPSSLMAVKAPTLRYNSYTPTNNVEPKMDIELSSFKQYNPLPALKPEMNNVEDIFYLYDCSNVCWLNITFDKQPDQPVTILFWHIKQATITYWTIDDNKNISIKNEVSNVNDWKMVSIMPIDKQLSLGFQTLDDSILPVWSLGLNLHPNSAKAIHLSAEDLTKEGLLSKNNQAGVKSSIIILPDPIEMGASEWINFEMNQLEMNCFEATYLMTSARRLFTLFLQHYSKDFVQSYRLFHWFTGANQEENGKLEKFQFCLEDFIEKKSIFFIHQAATRLMITTEGNENHQDGHKHPEAILNIQQIKRNKPKNALQQNFFNELHKDKTWSTIVPGLINDKERAEGKINIPKVSHPLTYQFHSIWIPNTSKLSLTPAVILLQAQAQTLLENIQLNLFLCDEVMECLPMDMAKKMSPGQNELEFHYTFDPHPNVASPKVKLLAEVIIAENVINVESALIVMVRNFGDPCYINHCPSANYQCNDQSDIYKVKANDFEAVCSCKAEWTGVDCNVKNNCNKNQCQNIGDCRNTANDQSYECVCSTDKQSLKYWQHGECKPFNVNYDKNVWTFDLNEINLNIYDICYAFDVNVQETLKTDFKDIDFKLELINKPATPELGIVLDERILRAKLDHSNESIIRICLNQLLDVRALKMENMKLVATVKADGITWPIESSYLYSNQILNIKQTKIDDIYHNNDNFLTIPNNLINIKESKDKDITRKNLHFVPIPHLNGPQTITIYSGWYRLDTTLTQIQLNTNLFQIETSLPKEMFEYKLFICRPRTFIVTNCYELTMNNWYQILYERLNIRQVFQLQANLMIKNYTDLPSDTDVSLRMAIEGACEIQKVQCQHEGMCVSLDATKFECHCQDGFTGIYCEIEKAKACTPELQESCEKINSQCQPTDVDQFTCTCPNGYHFNETSLSCQRLIIQKEQKLCGREYDDACWLSLIDEEMNYLPRYFPHISDPLDVTNKGLYYSLQSGSRLSIEINYKDTNTIKKPEMDICFHFRYMLAPGALLKLILESTTDSRSIDLFEIEGDQPIKTEDQSFQVDLSEGQTLCLKSLIDFNALSDLLGDAFKVTFITHSSNPESTVSLQIIPLNDPEILELRPLLIGSIEPFKFLTASNVHQESLNSAPDDLFLQWPLRWPLQRWSIDDQHKTVISFKGSKTGSISLAYLESHWLKRSIQTLKMNKVFFIFTMEILDKLQVFEIEIVILDHQRKVIGTLKKFSSSLFENSESIPSSIHFNILANQFVQIDDNSVYKLAFKIRYHDESDKVLFNFKDISFGDPCASVKCFDLDADHKPNQSDDEEKCQRLIHPVVDYKCQCPKGLTGKDCGQFDYCAWKHLNDSESLIDGDEFCTDAKCRPGKLNVQQKEYNFICHCPGRLHSFNTETRQCEPLSPCLLAPCDFEKEECFVKTLPTVEASSTTSAPLAPELMRECKCAKGFHLNVVKNVEKGENVAECQPIVPCSDVNSECPDPNMECIPNGKSSVCRCRKGFLADSQNHLQCISDLCSFPGFNTCDQQCTNIQKSSPYYQCTCESKYYQLESMVDNKSQCRLKVDNSKLPLECRHITNHMQYCSNGGRLCAANFLLEGEQCLPRKESLKYCPKGKYQLNKNTGRVQCECDEHYWITDSSTGTCTLANSICSEGNRGHKECSARNSFCRVNPLNIEEFECVCPPGKRYANAALVKSWTNLQEEPSSICIDICELPYRKSACAAIGGQCNRFKLSYQTGLNAILPIDPKKYCDCVPGTFLNSISGLCEQKENSFVTNVAIYWNQDLQAELIKLRKERFMNLFFDPFHFATDNSEGTIDFQDYIADPIGITQHQLMLFQHYQQQLEAIDQDWTWRTRRYLLLKQVRTLLYSAQMISNFEDVDVLDLTFDSNVYSLKLVISPKVAFRSTVMEANIKMVEEFTKIVDECKSSSIDENACVIPYLRMMMRNEATKPTITISQPCANQPCHGMSDCQAIGNTSYFTCTCNEDYFTPISRFQFATDDPTMVLKNEQCQAKNLCSKCNVVAKERCVQEEPKLSPSTGLWTREVKCVCQDGYQFDLKGKCVSLCSQLTDMCNGHGVCQVKGKDETVCRCDDDYYGDRCEHYAWSRTPWIISVAVLAVLVVVFLILAICLCRRLSSQSSPSSSSSPPSSLSPPPPSSSSTTITLPKNIDSTSTTLDSNHQQQNQSLQHDNSTHHRSQSNIFQSKINPSISSTLVISSEFQTSHQQQQQSMSAMNVEHQQKSFNVEKHYQAAISSSSMQMTSTSKQFSTIVSHKEVSFKEDNSSFSSDSSFSSNRKTSSSQSDSPRVNIPQSNQLTLSNATTIAMIHHDSLTTSQPPPPPSTPVIDVNEFPNVEDKPFKSRSFSPPPSLPPTPYNRRSSTKTNSNDNCSSQSSEESIKSLNVTLKVNSFMDDKETMVRRSNNQVEEMNTETQTNTNTTKMVNLSASSSFQNRTILNADRRLMEESQESSNSLLSFREAKDRIATMLKYRNRDSYIINDN